MRKQELRVEEESDQLIRCDMSIDRQIHPELYDEVSKIKDPRRRATFIRVCAEKYLVMKAASDSPQGLTGHGGTYHQSSSKCHSSNVALTTQTAVSATAADSAPPLPTGGAAFQAPPTGAAPAEKRDQADSSLALTKPIAVSAKQSGSAALASILGGMTPGLR